MTVKKFIIYSIISLCSSLTYVFLVILIMGCTSYNEIYPSRPEFRTMEECRIAYRLKDIDNKRLQQCITDKLPETIF